MAIMTEVKDGASAFGELVTLDEIDVMYNVCQPTASNIVHSLFYVEVDQKDQKVYRWLIRYVKSFDKQTASRFVRFCTASDVVAPGRRIKVEFENTPEAGMRPRARTCFSILTLPKNYATYNQMRDNLDLFIRDPQKWDLND